ncbi:phosphomannomutase/phosphoglucomutase [Candidatus Marsarchaeota archaeon]|nr:phosphomannomutase/phosphoglucomutase [Candidatus Marsarchaeota archaeon]
MADQINSSIFRAYDIRGIYPKDIDEKVAGRIGRAFAEYIGVGKRVLEGRDVRESSPTLSDSVVKAVLESGVDITYAGVVPTPLLGFAVSRYGVDGGIMVSASHNPPEWNGFKMYRKDGYVIGGSSGMEEIRKLAEGNSFAADRPAGRIEDKSTEIRNAYMEFLLSRVGSMEGLKVGIDPGNGAYSGMASQLFTRKGAEVHAINDVADGRFPSRSPEPSPSTIIQLVELVKSDGLDIGVAFDGDGDRVLFVTGRGDVLGGDIVLALLIRQYVRAGEKVAYEVSCSKAVEDVLEERRGVPVLTKVGHSFFKDAMKRGGCTLGGEISGHMYFNEIYGNDDGLFAALKVAGMVAGSGKSLSDLAALIPRYVKISMEFRVDDNRKFRVVERIRDSVSRNGYEIIDIDGVKAVTEDGWFVIRASNTGPMIKMTAEARDKKRLEELAAMARGEFEKALAGS